MTDKEIFDRACRKYNEELKDFGPWCHDVECIEMCWDLEEPPADVTNAGGGGV